MIGETYFIQTHADGLRRQLNRFAYRVVAKGRVSMIIRRQRHAGIYCMLV